ncbi:hypothetical protein [Nocardia sp. NPDC050435]|uniref:hypothetical protein n=1 Tax=Nocardia sp. NPDC050435 TaxID=3155040 RepID=UPI003408D8F4
MAVVRIPLTSIEVRFSPERALFVATCNLHPNPRPGLEGTDPGSSLAAVDALLTALEHDAAPPRPCSPMTSSAQQTTVAALCERGETARGV